jgi:hypothetical protein
MATVGRAPVGLSSGDGLETNEKKNGTVGEQKDDDHLELGDSTNLETVTNDWGSLFYN